MDETYTPQEVAEILKIAKNTVYELIKRGELKGFKVGKKVRVNRKDVEIYLNRGVSENKMPELNAGYVLETPGPDLRTPENRSEIIICGQDLILDILARYLEKELGGVRCLRSYSGSYHALTALYFGQVQIASSHLWDSDSGEYNIPYVRRLVPGIPVTVIHLAGRMAGFYVEKGNPKNIKSWHDLVRPDVMLINREKGSGIRVLLDENLKKLRLSSASIQGYHRESTSHFAVASTVARKGADVGIGNEKTAQQIAGIDFIPLQKEQYDLAIRTADLEKPAYQKIIGIIRSPLFLQEIEGIGGYDLSRSGKVIAEL